jgi:hypothetical protein
MTDYAVSLKLRRQWQIGPVCSVCLLVIREQPVMIRVLTQTIGRDRWPAWRAFQSFRRAMWRSMSESLRIVGSAIGRVFLASANFWNITGIGEEETRESRHFRKKHYI